MGTVAFFFFQEAKNSFENSVRKRYSTVVFKCTPWRSSAECVPYISNIGAFLYKLVHRFMTPNVGGLLGYIFTHLFCIRYVTCYFQMLVFFCEGHLEILFCNTVHSLIGLQIPIVCRQKHRESNPALSFYNLFWFCTVLYVQPESFILRICPQKRNYLYFVLKSYYKTNFGDNKII